MQAAAVVAAGSSPHGMPTALGSLLQDMPPCLHTLPCRQVALSAFAYLFSEMVQYCQSRVSNISELERK